MGSALVTGSGGLVGSATVRLLADAGLKVVGIDNDTRSRLFGPGASTLPVSYELCADLDGSFEWLSIDVRNRDAVEARVARMHDLELVVHCAAQPAHDWAARDPHADFAINAIGTMNVLEAVRRYRPDATFVHCSTSKVYGDTPNRLPLIELGTRLTLPMGHQYASGIDTSMSIDQSLHSLFGASKAAADLMVQEYGRYFGMPTVCLRPGCLTGPAHAPAMLHGFLAWLVRCAVRDEEYTVIGYDGKQVRDNLHGADVAAAALAVHRNRNRIEHGAVFNLGGGLANSCSIVEAIQMVEAITGREVRRRYEPQARIGDHRWWVSNNEEFEDRFPEWSVKHGLRETLLEIHDRQLDLCKT
jgi:CDP-paratose 2-epimerase